MADMSATRLQDVLAHTVGPTPWYWQTFPAITSVARQRFDWSHQGEEGPVGYVVTLGLEQEPGKPRLALNSYCRPFFVAPSYLGIWCPEGRGLRITCFDPDDSKPSTLRNWRAGSSNRATGSTRTPRPSRSLRSRSICLRGRIKSTFRLNLPAWRS